MRKLFLLTAFSAFLTIQPVYTSNIYAQTVAGLAAGHFVAEGRAYYEQGKSKQAIDSFSKALLSDPDNEEAKEYLAKLGISGSIYLGQGTQLEEITRLSRTVSELKTQNEIVAKEAESLQQEVRDLAGQKEGLESQLDQKKEEIVKLNADLFQMKHALSAHLTDIQEKTRQLDEIEAELVSIDEESPAVDAVPLEESKNQGEQDVVALQEKLKVMKEEDGVDNKEQTTRIKELEKELANKKVHLAMVNDKLILAKRKIKERYAQMSKKDETVESLKRALDEMKNDLRQAKLKLRAVGRAKTQNQGQLAAENEEQVAMLKKQDAFILDLKNKLVETKRELSELKKKFAGRSAEGDGELQARLDETLQQLDETQIALQEKSEEYEVLQQRFEDTRERLELVEGLMQDKDAQIEGLEQDLDGILEDSLGTP